VSLSAIPRPLRTAVLERDERRCGYCQLHQFGQGAVFHINHIVPRSKGGATVLGNLVLQCPYCSLHKSDKTIAADPESEGRVALSHPILQEWRAHFVLRREGICLGLTPTGRATADALRMNDALPRAARALQLMLGLIEIGST
jgi:hypothetical protein